MSKLFSIITPTYNSSKTLEQCILSVGRQGDFIEHIIIDGGSQDGTIELLKKYEKKYNIIWRSEKDKGIADAMNKGFSLAKGEIFAWLDADNYYEPNMLKVIKKIFDNNINFDIIHGNINIVNEYGIIKYTHKPVANLSYKIALIKTSGGVPLQPGCFFKKSLYQKTKGFNINYKVAGDIDFWMKALKENPNIYYIDQTIGNYRIEDMAKSQSLKGILLGLKEMKIIYKNNNQSFIGKILLTKKYIIGYIKTILKNAKNKY